VRTPLAAFRKRYPNLPVPAGNYPGEICGLVGRIHHIVELCLGARIKGAAHSSRDGELRQRMARLHRIGGRPARLRAFVCGAALRFDANNSLFAMTASIFVYRPLYPVTAPPLMHSLWRKVHAKSE
jgi:hypothetical protein